MSWFARCSLVAVVIACAGLPAQEVLWHAVGRPNDSALQEYVIVLGDVDGDGYDEIANLGLSGQSNQHAQTPTAIRILNGRTGAVMRTRFPAETNYHFIRLTPAGDWDGDGVRDYAVTRYAFAWPFDPTIVEVLSGRDDRALFAVRFALYTSGGEDILGDLDTDGDGRPDLVCSASRESPQGGIYVFRRDGTARLRIALPSYQTVTRIGAVGDIDSDGCGDFGYYLGGALYPFGAALVVSGRTGALLVTGTGEGSPGLGSGAIVGCGDVDGDGTPDFAASSHGLYPTLGIVRVFSGSTGAPIHTFRKAFGPNGSAFGWGESIASGFDLDQDGIQDLVVGGCGYDCDSVRQVGDRLFVYLLRDGREIEICTPGLSAIGHFTQFGFRVAAGRPQRGNAFPVFVCGEYQYGSFSTTYNQGRVTLFRLPPSALRPHSQGCSGTLARVPRAGVVDLGRSGVRVHLSDAPPGAVAALLVGNSSRTWAGLPLPLKLEPFGLPGCELATSILVELCTSTGTQGIAAGYASLDVALPIASGIGRGTLHAQWLVLGQGPQAPGALTGALSWRY